MILQQVKLPATARSIRVFDVARVEAQGRRDRGASAARRDGAHERGHFVRRVVAGRGVGHVGRAAFLRHRVPVGSVA